MLSAHRWVGARRVTLRHVSSRPPFSTGRAAFTASGAAPEVLLHVEHGASVSISAASTDIHPCLIPFHQPTLVVQRGHSLRVRWVLCSPLTFVLRTSPGSGPSPSVLVLVYVAFPRSDYYAPSDCLLGLGVFVGVSLTYSPPSLTSLAGSPVFVIEDSSGML